LRREIKRNRIAFAKLREFAAWESIAQLWRADLRRSRAEQLGRTHTSADIPATFQGLREAGFENINFDFDSLDYPVRRSQVETKSRSGFEFATEHLSLYLLDVHEGTPLADQIQSGMRPRPDDDLAGECTGR